MSDADQNWMSAVELRAIADFCERLDPLWDALTSGPSEVVTVDSEGIELSVYDSNGDRLGKITWADGGPAFYPAREVSA